MSFAVYLIKVNLALLLFWALYRGVLKSLTFFQWNRFYLMGSIFLSLLMPLVRVKWGVSLMAAAAPGGIDWAYVDHLAYPVALTTGPGFRTPGYLLWILYITVGLFLFVKYCSRFRELLLKVKGSTRIRRGKVNIYVHDHQMGAFTLFRRIYLDRHTYRNHLRPVLKHEMIHAVQLHSFDLLVMELVTAMVWFNPLVFVLKRYVRENHEYLADHFALGKKGSLMEYLECMKAETIRHLTPVPASNFNSSTMKNRIRMLTNHSSINSNKCRYLGILPVVTLMIMLFHNPSEQSLAISARYQEGLVMASRAGFLKQGVPSKFPLPEKYREAITWEYNQQAIHPITKKLTNHQGIDVAAPKGTPVFASGDGVVKKAAFEEGWGNLVVVEHEDGYTTFYAHLDEIGTETGAVVNQGEVIGVVGNTGQSTGSHLHYEVRKNGLPVNPADFF
jgi:hypothetical protein